MTGYVKTFILAVLALLGILLIIQNYGSLTQEVSLRLNLYLWEGNTSPYPVYMIVLLAFLLGIVLASLAGLNDRIQLRGRMKEAIRRKDEVEKEIISMRGRSMSSHGESKGLDF